MKVDRGRNKKPTSALPPACQELIKKLLSATDNELAAELKKVESWSFGKCELYHWIGVLDRVDTVLASGTAYPDGTNESDQKKILSLCPRLQDPLVKDRVMTVVRFTALLIEHSYARHVYNSVEHLLSLMNCSDMDVVLQVLNVFYVFGKRSNFLSRLYARLKSNLSTGLEHLGKTWGGRENGFGLAECCKYKDLTHFPATATSVVFEYSLQEDSNSETMTAPSRQLQLKNVHEIPGTLEEIFTQLVETYHIPKHQQLPLLFKLRTARYFGDFQLRLKCIEARLQSIAIGISGSVHSAYSLSPSESLDTFLYPGLIEEIVEVLELPDQHLMDIKAAALRALTAIVHLEKNPKLNEIVESTGTYAYHGFLPTLVRVVITSVTGPGEVKFSQSFATALFSFLYHLSSYQYSAESLVSSGTVEALLQVVSWKATEPSGITFVTRAVRVLDLITNIDVSAFHGQEGWQKLLDRLEYEVEQCSLDVPGTLPAEVGSAEGMSQQAARETPLQQQQQQTEAMDVSEGPAGADSTARRADSGAGEKTTTERKGTVQCIPQRSALIKSILNFFRKIVPDTTFADDVRSLHHSVLPNALKHIFSNGEYYGATLYLAAMDLFTSIVYHEPVMLSNLLDRGLPGVILNSFIMKDLPQTSEVLCAVPNCISALCLNEVIRRTIVGTQPFDRLLKTLISPEYHLTMKKHNRGDRSTVPNTIGVCVDQLLRHQTELRGCFMDALLRLLDNTIQLGMGPEPSKEKAEHASRVMDSQEDDEEVEEVSGVFLGSGMGDVFGLEKEEELAALNAPPPQVESVINVVLFLTSVLCHNRSSDHAELFLTKGGINKLYKLAALPNFPIDFPTMSSSTTLASIYGAILSITSNVSVVTVGLTQFGDVLDQLSGQLQPVLGQLQESVDLPAAVQVVNSGTLLHTISHTHCYLVIFNSLARIMHTSRFTNQPVPRHVHTLQVQAWSKECGTAVLHKLAVLYRDLIWANFHLMAILDTEKVKYPPPPPPPEAVPSEMETGGKDESSSAGTATVDSGIAEEKDGVEAMETGSSDEQGKGEPAQPEGGAEGVEGKAEGEEGKAEGEEGKAEGEEGKVEGEEGKAEVEEGKAEGVEGKAEGEEGKAEGEEGKAEGEEGKAEGVGGKAEGEEGKAEGEEGKAEGEEGKAEGEDGKAEGEDGKAEGEKEATQGKEGGKADSSSSDSSESEDEFGEKKKKRKKPDTEEIKILRGGNNFLTLSSRVSRAMSELFNQLVLLIGEPPPKSRGQTVRPPMVLTPEIVLLSKLIVKIIVQFLRDELPVISKGFIPTEDDQSSTLFGHLAVNMYFLELCELLLFDDNRSAFHVLLKYFEEEGGIEILKEGYEHGMTSLLKCPKEGPIEGVVLDYFEMWLCFMEKIFSYDGTVRGSHVIPEPKEDNGAEGAEKMERLEFHPVHFFMKAQRILGPCVVKLWKSPYLAHFKPRNTDLLLSVVRLLVESTENIEAGLKKWEAKEKEAKEKEAKKKVEEAAQQAGVSAPPLSQMNPAHVQQLMDMSFTRDQAEEALQKHANVEQATEWLLNKPPEGTSAAPLSEDDQLSLAIALSLEQAAKDQDPSTQMEVNPNAPPPFSDDAMIHEIAEDIIQRWRVFVFDIPDTVFRVSSLMCSLCERMGSEYMCKLHEQLMAEVLLPESTTFIGYFEGLTDDEKYQKLRDPNFKGELDRFRIVMHLLAQYAKEEPLVTMQMAQMGGFDVIVKVLTTTLPGLTRINRVQNMHGWIAHLLVALDLCLKQFEFVKWKTPEDMKVQWLWFDENIGKWTPYTPEGTASIEKAFLREDSSVKVTANRQKQTVALSHMLQVTGSISPDVAPSRPVVRMLLPPVDSTRAPCSIDGLTHKAAAEVARVCTLLIPSALDKEGMHANFRLLVRFTRWEDLTQVFVDNQGVEKMFRARRRSGFKSYYSMACLIIRHIFEMGPMRRFVFERNFIKMANSPYFQFQKEVHPVGDQSKEFFYVMRRLSGAARRDYDMFCEMVTKVFKLNGPFPDPSLYAGTEPVPAVQLTVMPPSEPIPTELSEAQQKVLKCMTDTIIKRDLPRLSSEYDRPKDLADDEQKVSRRIRIVSGWPTEKEREKAVAEDLEAEKKEPPKSRYDDSDSDTEYYRSKDKAQVELDIKNDAPELWRRYELPVLTKAALTRMMMELVECYPTILPYLCHCQKMVKMEKREPAEEMTFFSFLLDYLLAGDMRISSFMGSRLPKRLLESILTSEYVNSEVQEVFVHEFKQSVVKCLQLPECMMKHNRLRSLCSLLNYFMESRTSKPLHTITRLLIHKGIISDLAHSSYSLDLDNSSFSTTMNAILRPLDRLIRYVNQVNAQARQHRHAKQAQSAPGTGATVLAITSHPAVEVVSRLVSTYQVDASQLQRLQQRQLVTVPAGGGAGSTSLGTREAETQQPASDSQPPAGAPPVSSSTPVVEGQRSDEVHDSTMDAESQQTEEPLVPLEVHDDDVREEGELSDLMGVMLEAQLDGEHLSEDSDAGSEEDMYHEEEGDVEVDNYNSAGEEKESDYDASHAEDVGHESEETHEQEHVREVMISFRDELSSEHSGRENEGETPFDDSADIDVGVEGDVESTGDDDEVEEEEMEGGLEAEDLVDDPQEGDDSQEDDDSDRDVDSNDEDDDDDSSLLDSDADDSWPRAREGSNSSSSSGGSRTQRFHQPDETGPIPLVHPLTIRRIVQVYSLATGRLVNQRSEHHSEGAEHIRYRRIALQAGIMRPTFNPTSSVSQLMAGGERQEKEKDSPNSGSLMMMEDYEMGPVHGAVQRWDEAVNAMDGLAKDLMIGHAMWEVGGRLQEAYEQEQANKKTETSGEMESAPEENKETSFPAVQPGRIELVPAFGRRYESRNIEEASSVATRGSSPTQSVMTLESERSLSPPHTTASGTVGEPRQQPASRESTPQSHETREETQEVHMPPSPSQAGTQQEVPQVPQEVEGSRQVASVRLAQLEPGDPLHTFFSAVAGAPYPPVPPPSSRTVGSTTSGAAATEGDLEQEESTSSSSPSDTLGPLLTSSLTVSSTNTLTTVSASGTQPIPTSNVEPKHEDEMEVEPRGALEVAGSSSSEQGAVGLSAQGLLSADRQSTNQAGTVAEGEPSSSEVQETVEGGEERSQGEPQEGEQRNQGEPQEGGELRSEGEPQEGGEPNGAVAVAGGSGREDATEDIDPTFLAALPSDIRQEVLAQHRSTRERHSAHEPAGEPSGVSTGDASRPSAIDEGVLAQLPPNIQAEVRQQQAGEGSLPVTDAEWTAFFSGLLPSLRRSIINDLSEQDDATLQNLPEEIMTDIRRARLDRERRRMIMEQLASHAAASSTASYALSAVLQGRPTSRTVRISTPKDNTTKQILDPEAITCLLVLLFMEQHRLHVHRMHRVIRQISQHPETRAWVMATIINIIEDCHGVRESAMGHLLPLPETVHHRDQWLNLTCAGALGSHSPVFSTERTLKGGSAHKVSVHPHACPIVCKNALELLVVMAKQFPTSFLPPKLIVHPKDPALPPPLATHQVTSNFWQLLTRLNDGTARKGKGSSKMSQYGREEPEHPKSMFSQSFIAHLIHFLEHPVISKNPVLTNKLLRMLVVISGAIPRTGLSLQSEEEEKEKEKQKEQSAAAVGGGSAQGEAATPQQVNDGSAVPVAMDSLSGPSGMQGHTVPEARGDTSSGPSGVQGRAAPVAMDSSSGPSGMQGHTVPEARGDTSSAPSGVQGRAASDAMDSSSGPSGVQGRDDDVFEKEEESIVEPRLLRYIMKLLLCSASLTDSAEEDATKLLMNLSHSSPATRQAVMHLMIEAAKDVGRKVREQIVTLLEELIANMASLKKPHAARGPEREGGPSSSQSKWPPSSHPALRGVVLPQGAGSKKKVDHTHDIHLPAMTPLTCKGSQQALFLRILKVVHDLRDAALIAAKGRLRRQGKVSRDFTMDQLLPRMSVQLEMEELWEQLSQCLDALADTQDPHAVLVLQPAVEAFFIVHGVSGDYRKYKEIEGSESVSPHPLPSLSDDFAIPGSPLVHPTIQPPPTLDERSTRHMPADLVKFLKFAEAHRTVLNSILRQMGTPLGESPFAILVEHAKLLDFDIKRRYFRQELDAMTDGSRREDLVLHIRRSHLFADSFRELYHRSPYELQSNLYISFEGEEGQDAGGVQREWYLIISREIFNPGYAMFKTTPGGRTYVPNPSSHINPDHLQYFKFVGRVIAKAIADNKLLDCFFSRSFYKHIIGKPVQFSDLEAEDYSFYQSMRFLLEHVIDDLGLDLTFSTEVTEFGETKTKDLTPGGHNVPVVEENKKEYVKFMCQLKMTDSIKPQLRNFLEGFYEVIPRDLISIFNEQELELMISGLPVIDLEDLRNNTEYHKYSPTDLQIQWFWRALKSFDETDRARFLQFVTGTSRVPLQGFSSLEGMSGPQKFQIHRDDRSVGRLPSAHTCFNQLDLPVYSTYDELHKMLLLAIREGHEGFGFI